MPAYQMTHNLYLNEIRISEKYSSSSFIVAICKNYRQIPKLIPRLRTSTKEDECLKTFVFISG